MYKGVLSGLLIEISVLSCSFASIENTAIFSKGVVASVNDKPITQQQLEESVQDRLSQLRSEGVEEAILQSNFDRIKKECLEKLIQHVLLIQAFEDKKGKVLPTELENHVQALIQEHFQGNREAFMHYLKKKGQSYRSFQKEAEASIIVRVMMHQKEKSALCVSPKAIEAYYNAHKESFLVPASVRLMQIGFKSDSTMQKGNDVQSKYDYVVACLKEGRSFEFIANEVNELNGEATWYQKEELHPTLASVAFELPVGSCSQPLLVNNYYFVLRVLERQNERIKPLQEAQAEIETQLIEETNAKAYQNWICQLREKAYIRYF